MRNSRIPGLYRKSVGERIQALEDGGWLSPADADRLRSGRHVLPVGAADLMVENVLGAFGLPLAIAPNFLVNGKDYIVPLVVEEPSIVAALSAAAGLARKSGGMTATVSGSCLTGQVHLSGLADADAAIAKIESAAARLKELAEAVHPRLLGRGGGVREVTARRVETATKQQVIVAECQVDTRDAMGANLVNTICETLAPELERLTGGQAALSILSNLTDRSMAEAMMTVRLDDLSGDNAKAQRIRDAIILADEIAAADPYRAATHNKGIMNAIDPIAIATGNDWRAIEAGAHAYAARDGQYRALTRWSVAPTGDLQGTLRMPIKPGIVGGTLSSNPGARLCLDMTGVESAAELADLMAAAGIAQNFSALRALTTAGIQKGHMRLHARSVVAAAGVPRQQQQAIIRELIASGDVKEWKARELYAAQRRRPGVGHAAAGKIILLGEHAVVYGRHALALPISRAVTAVATPDADQVLRVPAWDIDQAIDPAASTGIDAAVNLIKQRLGVADEAISLDVDSRVPPAMGLGASAAFAVAVTRAIADAFEVRIDDDGTNAIAFACEQLAHGTPSGVDNTVACFGKTVLYQKSGQPRFETIGVDEPLPLVVACAGHGASTSAQVAGVRRRYDLQPAAFEKLFDQVDELVLAGAEALRGRDIETLGRLMDLCHGLLNAMGVSTPELESMVTIARNAGAVGAKLTGAGGGGAVVALCPGSEDDVTSAFEAAGFRTLSIDATDE